MEKPAPYPLFACSWAPLSPASLPFPQLDWLSVMSFFRVWGRAGGEPDGGKGCERQFFFCFFSSRPRRSRNWRPSRTASPCRPQEAGKPGRLRGSGSTETGIPGKAKPARARRSSVGGPMKAPRTRTRTTVHASGFYYFFLTNFLLGGFAVQEGS